jgi:hypothetical protein
MQAYTGMDFKIHDFEYPGISPQNLIAKSAPQVSTP